jgi:gliding motility-associated-like protein
LTKFKLTNPFLIRLFTSSKKRTMKKSALPVLIFILIGISNLFAQQLQQSPTFQMRDGACQGIPPALSDADRDGNGVLGESLNITRCGLNYVDASRLITTRCQQVPPFPTTNGGGFPATLSIAGLPAGVVIERALLYWIVSYQSGSSTAPTAVLTNPLGATNNYVATLIGSGPSKCWGEAGTRAFRCDVTSAVAGNGNYVINNIIGNTAWEVDGATLLIIYSDASASFRGTLKIDDGMVIGIATTTTLQVTNFNTCANAAYIDGFVMASDLQNNIGPTHQCTINNNVYPFPNNFWNFDRIATTTSGCQVSGNFGIIPTPGDCYAYCASGIYYRIPTNPGCTVNNLTLASNVQNPNCGMTDGSISVVPTNGSPPYTYVWSNSANTAAINNLGAGTYTVTVSDVCGCLTATASFTLTSGPAIVLTTSTIDATCNLGVDGSATATLVSGGTPPYTYSWSTVPVQTNTTATGLAAGVYTVTCTDVGGCTGTATVTINEPPALVASVQNVTHTLCALNNGSVEGVGAGGTGAFTYSWNSVPVQNTAIASNLAPGTYTVIITDANGCTSSTSVTINPSTIPVVSPTVVGQNPICVSQSTILDAPVVGGTPPYTYFWYQPPTGLSAYNIQSPTANPTVTTTYMVDVTDVNGCLSQPASTTVTVYDPLVVTPTGTTAICIGASATISVSGSGGDGSAIYSWDNGLGLGTGPFTVSPTVSTTYTVTMSDGCGSPAVTGSVVITVSPTPVVDFQFLSVSECAPYTAKFGDASTVTSPSYITQWLWDFGDGGNSGEQHASHGYLTGGTYMVYLTVITNDGCTAIDSMEQVIDVQAEYSFYIPNAFTPNGDNINEFFYPLGESIKEYDLVIYDRWGLPVFKSKDIRFVWDGELSSGKPANEGIYNYVFTMGSIALIR